MHILRAVARTIAPEYDPKPQKKIDLETQINVPKIKVKFNFLKIFFLHSL